MYNQLFIGLLNCFPLSLSYAFPQGTLSFSFFTFHFILSFFFFFSPLFLYIYIYIYRCSRETLKNEVACVRVQKGWKRKRWLVSKVQILKAWKGAQRDIRNATWERRYISCTISLYIPNRASNVSFFRTTIIYIKQWLIYLSLFVPNNLIGSSLCLIGQRLYNYTRIFRIGRV